MSEDSQSRRPAEKQLIIQFTEERNSLLDGFENRREVLRWGQRITVRTLGQIHQRHFHQLAKEFVPDREYMEGVLLAAFLRPKARTRDLEDDIAEKLRERWAAEVLGPVKVQAFRNLRKDAGEFIVGPGESGAAGYDPEEQDFVMRPALSELDDFQREALEMVIDGLEDKSEILDWGDVLTSATRGEPIDPKRPTGSFIPKAYREPSTVQLLTDNSDAYQRAREAFIAHWLLPAFNRGVRDLSGRTGEEPFEDHSKDDGGSTHA